MYKYFPHTQKDIEEMLARIGVEKVKIYLVMFQMWQFIKIWIYLHHLVKLNLENM